MQFASTSTEPGWRSATALAFMHRPAESGGARPPAPAGGRRRIKAPIGPHAAAADPAAPRFCGRLPAGGDAYRPKMLRAARASLSRTAQSRAAGARISDPRSLRETGGSAASALRVGRRRSVRAPSDEPLNLSGHRVQQDPLAAHQTRMRLRRRPAQRGRLLRRQRGRRRRRPLGLRPRGRGGALRGVAVLGHVALLCSGHGCRIC